MSHRSPGKPVQINKHVCSKLWSYENIEKERRKTIISFLIIKWSLFVQPWVPFTQGCFMSSLVEIDPMILQTILRFSSMYFCYFVVIPPFKKVWSFICTNLNSLSAKFGWNWLSGSVEEDFQISSMCFCYFLFISLGKRRGHSLEQIWIPFTKEFSC